jgi:hypothetical protein
MLRQLHEASILMHGINGVSGPMPTILCGFCPNNVIKVGLRLKNGGALYITFSQGIVVGFGIYNHVNLH